MRKLIFLISILMTLGVSVSPAAAFDVTEILENTGFVARETYDVNQLGTTESILAVIGRVVTIGIGILGGVAVILFIYAGFLWMTAGGNEDQIKKAKNIIKAVIIGLIIISIAYILVTYVVGQLVSDVPQRNN